MKIAVIGIGKWGSVLLKEFKEQVEVKYECDKDSDLEKVFNDPEIEAVAIATPTPIHFEIAMQALEAGKHVFLEKPGTESYEDLEKLVEKAKEKGVKLAIGYEYPHHPALRKAKELIGDKPIKSVLLEYQKWGTFTGDIVTNLLCHDISILKYLGFDSLSPSAKRIGVITEADILEVDFGNEKNVAARSVINRVSPAKQRTVTILLEKGGYIWSNNDLFEIEGDSLKQIPLQNETPVAAEIRDFLTAIKENGELFSNGKFALDIHRVLDQIQK